MFLGDRIRFRRAIQKLKEPVNKPVAPGITPTVQKSNSLNRWITRETDLVVYYTTLRSELKPIMQKLVEQTTDPKELGKGSDVWKRWYNNIDQGDSFVCPYDGFTVVSVDRIHNPTLWDQKQESRIFLGLLPTLLNSKLPCLPSLMLHHLMLT